MSEVIIRPQQLLEAADAIRAAAAEIDRQLEQVATEITITSSYENFRGNRATTLRANWQQAHTQIESWPDDLYALANQLENAAEAFMMADKTEQPVATTPLPPAAARTVPQQYVVQPGDTLSELALKHGTTVEALVAANNIKDPDLILIGQTLTIPNGSAAVPTAPPVAPLPIHGSGPYSPQELGGIIDGFNVESNGRYAARNGDTYCNLFASDVVQKLGAPLPLYTPDENGKAVKWLGATAMKEWLNGNLDYPGIYQQGTEAGWQHVDAATAADAANNGYVAVVAGHGHIAVVRPGTPEGAGPNDVLIAQAGARNFNSGRVIDGWGRYINEADFYVFRPGE